MRDQISAREAKRLADGHLRTEGSSFVARHATRDKQYGVWVVGYSDLAEPDVTLDGGGLVVTDDGEHSNPLVCRSAVTSPGHQPGAFSWVPGRVKDRDGLRAQFNPLEAA